MVDLKQVTYREANSQHTLSFNWFAKSSFQLSNPGTMDKNIFPNQQFRVDLMSAGFTNFFSTSSNGLLANILASTATPNIWSLQTFNLSP